MAGARALRDVVVIARTDGEHWDVIHLYRKGESLEGRHVMDTLRNSDRYQAAWLCVQTTPGLDGPEIVNVNPLDQPVVEIVISQEAAPSVEVVTDDARGTSFLDAPADPLPDGVSDPEHPTVETVKVRRIHPVGAAYSIRELHLESAKEGGTGAILFRRSKSMLITRKTPSRTR